MANQSQKILTLNDQNWLSGLCLSDDTAVGGGTFVSAPGFDISRFPGYLMGGYSRQISEK